MELATRIQILDKAVCILYHAYEKSMNSSLLPKAMGK